MIGKTYAKVSNYSNDAVTNKELADASGLREGTLRNILFRLRKEVLLLSVENGVHKAKVETFGMAFDRYFKQENKS